LKLLILSTIILAQLIVLTGCSLKTGSKGPDKNQATTSLKTLAGESISTPELDAYIKQTMEKADVTGLSCAIINDSQIFYQKAYGYKNKNDGSLLEAVVG
jgi:predicted small lipoprotein YifL